MGESSDRNRSTAARAMIDSFASVGATHFVVSWTNSGAASRNPVVDVDRPAINRDEGSTAAFSKAQARKLLDAPPTDKLGGLRDRAILSVGLQVGFRRAEIAALTVMSGICTRTVASIRCALRARAAGGNLLRSIRRPHSASASILEHAGHGAQQEAPLFRPLRGNQKKPFDPAGRMDPDAIDRVVRKYATKIGLDHGYSAHSMRATFITMALENGAQLEDVQKAAWHRNPSTTKLYDRRGYNPEKAASFFSPTDR